MSTTYALYESVLDGTFNHLSIEPPSDRSTSTGVASYLRFGERISDQILRSFEWKGKIYDPMGDELPTSDAIND